MKYAIRQVIKIILLPFTLPCLALVLAMEWLFSDEEALKYYRKSRKELVMTVVPFLKL